jgi:DNA-binding NtrC family response regulator
MYTPLKFSLCIGPLDYLHGGGGGSIEIRKSNKMTSNKRNLLESQQKIVVLDDDPSLLEYLNIVLNKQFSDCVVKCYDYPTAEFFKYVTENQVDVFIMDIKLGKFENGIKLTEDIIYKKRGTIFLFISGYPFNKSDFEHLNGRCVYDFMNKPLDPDNFIVVVSTLLNIASTYKLHLKIQE